MKVLFLMASILLLHTSLAFADDQCGEKERRSSMYKAVTSCIAKKAVNSALTGIELDQKLSSIHDGCMLINSELFPNQPIEQQLKNICKDPAGVLCSQPATYLITANCEMTVEATDHLKDLPAVIDEHCEYKSQEQQFIDEHRQECSAKLSSENCDAKIKVKHAEELRAMEWKTAYTPEKIARLTKIFSLVKDREIKLVQNSSLIPKDRKKDLVSLLSKTILDLPPFQSNPPPSCANAGIDGPEGGIYNDFDGHVEPCIGFIESLDYMSDYAIASTLGHEIGHSIDPCKLETIAANQHHPDPKIALHTYPGILSCLRGGSGEDGCTNSVLSCTSKLGIEQYCANQAGTDSKKRKDCITLALATPSCSDMSGPDPAVDDSDDLTLYRTQGEASDQVEESFADYIGSEVTGSLVSEHKLGSQETDSQERFNALSSIIADFGQLHGGCIDHNTKDAHPPARIRLNRIFMSSPRFREGFGCVGAPPKTKDAGASCPAI